MNGVFDLGGTDGLGKVVIPPVEPIFRAEWERKAFSLLVFGFAAGFFGLDQFRHQIEKMDPAWYLKSPYYEHWLYSVESHGIRVGVIDADELDHRTQFYLDNPNAPQPDHEPKPELVELANQVSRHGAPAAREVDRPAQFNVGDRVTVKTDSPFGHTRRARYVRGRTGEIVMSHGAAIYPDSAGIGHGEAPEYVYTVKFSSHELWGDETAEPNTTVHIDVFEPYIELATAAEGVAA